ncbi:MAG TPA: aminotransferase class I/II-fold pyridoxal phosphate-dependent enzyme [Steroidobacteraceae bacterium]|nr:aminotransferase class I/II-fold pyridoxal phosphate-dependent enzyme [Steroidobacteraceae bacterium]
MSNPHGVDLLGDAFPDGELIVDEAYAELRFDGRVPPPVAPRAPHRVWHVGTVSKTLCPGLRIGWLVPPPHRRASVLERKLAADLQTASLTQVAFARLLDVIDYDRMLVGARHRYAARADRLCSALRRYAPEVRFRDPEGGFSIWVETDDAGDDIDLLAAADRCPSIASIDGDLLQQFFTDADLALRVRGAQLVCNRALEIAHLGATLLVLSCHPAPGFVVITLSEARLKLPVFEPTPRRDEMSEAALEPEPPVRDVVPEWVVDDLLDGAENRVPGALHAPGARIATVFSLLSWATSWWQSSRVS